MKNYDVIIIGGGASGIYCALNIDRRLKVAILERADRIGKKILATGNGRCNISNKIMDISKYNTSKVAKYFNKYNNSNFVTDMNDLGLELYSDSEGRMYPLSNSANSVLDILLYNINDRENIDVVTECNVTKIAKDDNEFLLKTSNGEYQSAKLVIATGGNTAKEYMVDLDVKYSDFIPSLVALQTDVNKGLAGVRVSDVEASFKDFKQRGEILFKDNAISGIVIFNLSTVFARNNIHSGEISIDLLPTISSYELITKLMKCARYNPNYTVLEMLQGYLHKALARNIADKCEICGKLSDVPRKSIEELVNVIKAYKVNVVGLSDNNQVYSGGVSLDRLDDNLMYKYVPNLYFTGEVIDVDGECGGYNLQWAWTSAKIVGGSL